MKDFFIWQNKGKIWVEKKNKVYYETNDFKLNLFVKCKWHEIVKKNSVYVGTKTTFDFFLKSKYF